MSHMDTQNTQTRSGFDIEDKGVWLVAGSHGPCTGEMQEMRRYHWVYWCPGGPDFPEQLFWSSRRLDVESSSLFLSSRPGWGVVVGLLPRSNGTLLAYPVLIGCLARNNRRIRVRIVVIPAVHTCRCLHWAVTICNLETRYHPPPGLLVSIWKPLSSLQASVCLSPVACRLSVTSPTIDASKPGEMKKSAVICFACLRRTLDTLYV